MAETSNGCMSPIMFVLMVLSTFFTVFMNFGLAVESPPPTPVVATPTIEIILAPIETNITSEQLQTAYAVLDQRLTALLNSDEITVYELETTSDNKIMLRIDHREGDPLSLMDGLTTPGYLEFVDFSSVSTDALSNYKDTVIATTGSQSRMPADDGQEIFPTLLTYESVASAESFEDDFGNFAIQINLTEEGATALETFTENNTGKGLAIVLDNRVLTIPVIQTRIGSPIVLSGLFTETEANALALQLNTRPLPIALEIASMSQIQD